MSEFSERPFSAGSLIGIRTFKIDRLGRLAAVNFPYVWTPGENAAQCMKSNERVMSFFLPTSLAYPVWMGADPLPSVSTIPESTPPEPEAHQVAQVKCSCGFYAYFDNDGNPHHTRGQMHGIVEGYGVVTVGSRGFRAEKARPKALVIPATHKLAAAIADRVAANYGLPTFRSKAEAIDAFPLTHAYDMPTPASDPNFWTRSAS